MPIDEETCERVTRAHEALKDAIGTWAEADEVLRLALAAYDAAQDYLRAAWATGGDVAAARTSADAAKKRVERVGRMMFAATEALTDAQEEFAAAMDGHVDPVKLAAYRARRLDQPRAMLHDIRRSCSMRPSSVSVPAPRARTAARARCTHRQAVARSSARSGDSGDDDPGEHPPHVVPAAATGPLAFVKGLLRLLLEAIR